MTRREFQFSEGTSNKFWAIELDGTKHTVHYGRVGTTGQAQTKEFNSDDEAKKSGDKLIAEKVKKGYTEVTSGTKSASSPTAKAASKSKEAVAEAAAAPASPTIHARITRVIELNPTDWQHVTWRKRQALPRPAVSEFDFEACRERLNKLKKNDYGWVNWEKANIQPFMSPKEAHFWFLALTENSDKLTAQAIADKLKEKSITGEIELKRAMNRLKENPRLRPMLAIRCLFNLLKPDDVLTMLQDDAVMNTSWDSMTLALGEFTSNLFPYQNPSDISSLANTLRPSLDPNLWPSDFYKRPPMAFFLAALIGMHDELLAIVRSIPDDNYDRSGWDHTYYHQTQRIVFGLANSELVQSEMRRLKLPLRKPEFLRAWLALTEFSGLDYARDNILAETKKDICEQLLEVFCLVKAPEAAPHILELKLSSKAPGPARQWLDEQVGNAIAGLIPTAAGRGKLAEAAVEYLREARKKGHEKIIRECLKGTATDVAERVRNEVLDFAEKEYKSFNDKTTPGWLKDASKQSKPGKLPGWIAVPSLSPILVGEMRLNDDQVAAVVAGLARSTFDAVDPLVAAVKKQGDASSLDAFAWKLFQLWQGEGSPSKEKWAMGAVGHFGGDGSALKITPLIRNWPGESQHQRAVYGLDCLRAIGSDTALMQLNGISQKLKFKGLKQKANEAMEAIAKEKGLTKSQLEDRIVPDCDLDERGNRIFDFGPRQFRFVLGPDMKPMLKDADGKVKTDLPKPGAKDDAAKAEAAIGEWKLMKKQIKEVATIQAQRLEQAMVTGRRWTVADFEMLLVKHPLLTNVVRLILWAGYDKAGKLLSTFRVTEDQTYADAKDGEFKHKGIDQVGIVHPLHLTDEQKSPWGEIFSDYEIVPPFPQLGRTIHRLEKGEVKESELKRFAGIKLPAPTLVFGLEKFGWARGTAMDAGCFDEHSKPFPALEVTAVVHYEGTAGMGYIDPNEMLTIETCYFVKGVRAPSGYAHKEQTVKLADVDPVAVSEVLTDLTALAAKAK